MTGVYAYVRHPLYLGTLLFGAGFEPWTIMLLPAGGFFVLGGWLLLFALFRERKKAVV